MNIKVAGSGPGQEYSATIDTGFTGFVAMPIQEMITLGLKSEGAASVALGDGSVIYNLVAPASVTVGSQTVQGPILLDDTSSEILVGMAFLRAFRLALILTNTHVVLYDEAETLVAVANFMSTAPIGLPNTAHHRLTIRGGIVANQVLCINKSSRIDPHERITHIGGINDRGERWRITQQEAIQGIESGKWQFYVRIGLSDVRVIVAVSQYGNKYIKTETDGFQPNNLLSLPECRP